MLSLRTSVLFTLVCALAACAAQPAHKVASGPAQAPSATDDQTLVTLYARLDADEKRYVAARKVNPDQTAEAKAALDDLQAASNQCLAAHGCESQRFFAAFDHLLRLDSGMLDENPGAAQSDTPEASGEEGINSPVAAALPEVKRSVALLKGRQLSEIIEMNDPVKVALEQWLTQLRPNLMLAYENYEYMRYRMWPEYQKAGLPEALLFGMMAKESGGKVHAVSRSGASGPLQFMYATGSRFGLGTVNGFDQRFDPALSARANAAYLNEQLAVFNNNLELVIAAYNGGEGMMQRLAARNPNAGFWDPKIYFQLSPETRDYVPMVLAAAWLYLHPERYNLDFPKLDGQPATIILKKPASIDALTVCFGTHGNNNGWFRTLRNLNPAYEPHQELPVDTRIEVPAKLAAVYEKSCVSGKWAALASELQAASLPVVPARPAPRYYVVRKGDTLAGIARKLHCTSSGELASINHLRGPHFSLRNGQNLELPDCAKR